jgi:hypothetical protein
VLFFGLKNRRERNWAVERDELPGMLYCQGKQVTIGYLFGAMDARVIDDSVVENAQVVGPKFVV